MDKVKEFFTFRWQPGQDTGFALGTLLLFWACYWVGMNFTPELFAGVGFVQNSALVQRIIDLIRIIIYVVFGTAFLNVYFPISYIVLERREKLDQLGIKKQHVWLSLIVSAGLGGAILAAFALPTFRAAAAQGTLILRLIFNALGLGVPFFVFGWLQMRYDRAFGAIPAILLTGGSFALFHIGSVATPQLVWLLLVGLGLALAFRLTRNLLIIWPLAWLVVSIVGVSEASFAVTWGDVILYAVVLLVQLTALWWVPSRTKRIQMITA